MTELKTAAALGLTKSATKREIKRAWIDHYGPNCLFCDTKMVTATRFKNSRMYATIDHIDAQMFGGVNCHENMQVICRYCNFIKSLAEHNAAIFLGFRLGRMARSRDRDDVLREQALARAEQEIARARKRTGLGLT